MCEEQSIISVLQPTGKPTRRRDRRRQSYEAERSRGRSNRGQRHRDPGPEEGVSAFQVLERPPTDTKDILLLGRGRARVALKGLNVTFEEGSITALLGHNGAGKSTTIGMITGMVEPTRGSVRINGMDTVEEWREVKQMLGYCPQQSILYDSLTVIEHLQLYSTLKGGEAGEVRFTNEKIIWICFNWVTGMFTCFQVEQLLASMRMEEKADVQCGRLSEVFKICWWLQKNRQTYKALKSIYWWLQRDRQLYKEHMSSNPVLLLNQPQAPKITTEYHASVFNTKDSLVVRIQCELSFVVSL